MWRSAPRGPAHDGELKQKRRTSVKMSGAKLDGSTPTPLANAGDSVVPGVGLLPDGAQNDIFRREAVGNSTMKSCHEQTGLRHLHAPRRPVG